MAQFRLPVAVFATVLGLVISVGAQRQPAPAAPASPDTAALGSTIPADPQVLTGQFANGLRYYIRNNKKPENRAELRLVVNAGSVLEEDDQQGLAHFVEHMAFNGTKHFPKLDIVSFMESIGMRFGPSVNAFTSFDETVYMLQIPTDRMEVIDRAMLVLEDWAQNVSFDPEEIDKERGVILEEWRLRRGAAARIQDKQFPVLLKDSRYATRLPIGKPDLLRSFKHDRLRQFYKDWYRPDLMAVIAVGDFNTTAMQALIKTHFEPILPAPSPRRRTVFSVPGHGGTTYTIATDPELSSTNVSVYNIGKARDQATIGAYRQTLVEQIFTSMLNERLGEIAEKPDAPFLGASANRGSLVRTAEAAALEASVKPDGIERGLAALFVEAKRVADYGFTATELQRARTNALRAIDRAIIEKDNQQSASLASEYSRNFLTGEPIPGIVYEGALYRRFLPEITLKEVNELARNWVPDRNRVVAVSAPEKQDVKAPTQPQLARVIAEAGRTPIKAYEDAAHADTLLAAPPEGGRVTGTATKAALGITEWTLSNGVKVVLKPTAFRQDEISFRAFSPGGTSLASDAEWIPAITAAQVIGAGGLGTMSATELGKVLTGKVASVRPSISTIDEGLSGGGSVTDLETLFQLIYMTFTAPRADADIFSVMVDQTRTALANQAARPEYAFSLALTSALTQDHPRARPFTAEMVDQMDLQKSLAFYKERFADASDFTFVFVGSVTPDQLRPHVERYLASLPALNRHESYKDLGIRYPHAVIEKTVRKGIEPKSQTSLVFTGMFEYTQQNRTLLRAMSMALEGRLRNALREDLGGTYGVSVSPSYSKIPAAEYSVSVGFGADPARLEVLLARAAQEVESFKATGPTDRELADVKEGMLRDYESSMKTNNYLLSNLTTRYQLGEDVEGFFALEQSYRALTPADIQSAARQYLDTSSLVKVTLVPER